MSNFSTEYVKLVVVDNVCCCVNRAEGTVEDTDTEVRQDAEIGNSGVTSTRRCTSKSATDDGGVCRSDSAIASQGVSCLTSSSSV